MLPFEGVSSSDPLLDTSPHVAPPDVPASLRRSKMKTICYSAFLYGFHLNWFKTTNCQVKNYALKLYGAQSQHINHQVKQELSENCVT